MRSYYLHMNNLGEITCLRNELYKAVADRGNLPLSEFDRFTNVMKDAYFTGIAARAISRFRAQPSFADCMRLRDVYSYTILGVENQTPDRVRYTVHATNTTPIPEGAPRDQFARDMRSNGTRFRYELLRMGRDWRIAQIEASNSYSTSAPESWSAQFDENDLLPWIPFMVQSYPY